MPRFLSSEWFDAIRDNSGDDAINDNGGDSARGEELRDPLTLEQVVTGSPEGSVRYFVIVADTDARVVYPGAAHPSADLTITTDWETAVAIAKGELATQAALMQGKLRIRGNLSKLSRRAADLAGLDPIPESVRKSTSY